jgi:hypothetical protein
MIVFDAFFEPASLKAEVVLFKDDPAPAEVLCAL